MLHYLKQTSCPNLSVRVPSAAVAETNREVEVLQEAQKSQVGQKRGPYYCFTQEERAEICKYTAYHTTILNTTNACVHNQPLPIM